MGLDPPRFFPSQTSSGAKVTGEAIVGRLLDDLPPFPLDKMPPHPDPFIRRIFERRAFLVADDITHCTNSVKLIPNVAFLDLRGPVGTIKTHGIEHPVIAISIRRSRLGFIAQTQRMLLWLEIGNTRSGNHLLQGRIRQFPLDCLPCSIPYVRAGNTRCLSMYAIKPQQALVNSEPPPDEPNGEPKQFKEQH